jgi:hypothetical protein
VIRTLIRRIVATIREWLFPTIPVPGRLSINLRREIAMALEFIITIERTGTEAADITHGVMVVSTTLGGEPREVTVQVAADATSAGPFYASDGTEVNARFYWVDDAGNNSPEQLLTTTILDTLAPGQPGPLGINVTGEIPDDQVPPVA